MIILLSFFFLFYLQYRCKYHTTLQVDWNTWFVCFSMFAYTVTNILSKENQQQQQQQHAHTQNKNCEFNVRSSKINKGVEEFFFFCLFFVCLYVCLCVFRFCFLFFVCFVLFCLFVCLFVVFICSKALLTYLTNEEALIIFVISSLLYKMYQNDWYWAVWFLWKNIINTYHLVMCIFCFG